MTVDQLAAHLRQLYPDAVSVTLFVNVEGHEINACHKPNTGPEHGASYKCLDDQWAHRRSPPPKDGEG